MVTSDYLYTAFFFNRSQTLRGLTGHAWVHFTLSARTVVIHLKMREDVNRANSVLMACLCWLLFSGCSTHPRDFVTQVLELGETFKDCKPLDNPEQNTFCGYDKVIERCELTLLDEMESLASQYDFVTKIHIGTTHEAREIAAIRIGTQESVEAVPQVVLVGTQHGGERLVPEIAIRTIRRLIQNYQSDPLTNSFLRGVVGKRGSFEWVRHEARGRQKAA